MKRPLLFAHRGFSGDYPENSPLAFQMAVEKTAADGIESDVDVEEVLAELGHGLVGGGEVVQHIVHPDGGAHL